MYDLFQVFIGLCGISAGARPAFVVYVLVDGRQEAQATL